jgi:xylose isomerase
VFNFIEELGKMFFCRVDEDNVKCYNEQIKLFEQNLENMNTLLKQQLSIVRSSLGAVNHTFADVEYNEGLLKEGTNRVSMYTLTLKSETNEKLIYSVLKLRLSDIF